jgi:hypothetical protein
MKNLNILRTLIKEELAKLKENHSELENYMFFQHVRSINDATSQILQMDPGYVDSILSDGHQWAVDHITTSADDVSEVSSFLTHRQPMMENVNQSDLDSIIQSAQKLKGYGIALYEKDRAIISRISSELKQLLDAAMEGSDQMGSVDEKKLTKAELRKREDVAKGIKKSDPKMPMDKKMAIATAVAKKVAEAKKGFTPKYNDDPKLKGKQKNLPDAL